MFARTDCGLLAILIGRNIWNIYFIEYSSHLFNASVLGGESMSDARWAKKKHFFSKTIRQPWGGSFTQPIMRTFIFTITYLLLRWTSNMMTRVWPGSATREGISWAYLRWRSTRTTPAGRLRHRLWTVDKIRSSFDDYLFISIKKNTSNITQEYQWRLLRKKQRCIWQSTCLFRHFSCWSTGFHSALCRFVDLRYKSVVERLI